MQGSLKFGLLLILLMSVSPARAAIGLGLDLGLEGLEGLGTHQPAELQLSV